VHCCAAGRTLAAVAGEGAGTMACCCTAQLYDLRCAALDTQLPLTLLTPNQGVQECVLFSVYVV